MGLHTADICKTVGLGSIALRSPEGLREAIQNDVLSLVFRVPSTNQLLISRSQALRLINLQLLGNRQMQRQVQKRIGLTGLGRELVVDRRLAGVQQRMVFRMQQHAVAREHFHRCEREPLNDFSPGFEKKAPNLIARRIKQAHSGAGTLSRKPQRSITGQRQHSGRRALQT